MLADLRGLTKRSPRVVPRLDRREDPQAFYKSLIELMLGSFMLGAATHYSPEALAEVRVC